MDTKTIVTADEITSEKNEDNVFIVLMSILFAIGAVGSILCFNFREDTILPTTVLKFINMLLGAVGALGVILSAIYRRSIAKEIAFLLVYFVLGPLNVVCFFVWSVDICSGLPQALSSSVQTPNATRAYLEVLPFITSFISSFIFLVSILNVVYACYKHRAALKAYLKGHEEKRSICCIQEKSQTTKGDDIHGDNSNDGFERDCDNHIPHSYH